jgi:hypothetical protein
MSRIMSLISSGVAGGNFHIFLVLSRRGSDIFRFLPDPHLAASFAVEQHVRRTQDHFLNQLRLTRGEDDCDRLLQAAHTKLVAQSSDGLDQASICRATIWGGAVPSFG